MSSEEKIVFQEDDFKLAHRKDLHIDKVYENNSFRKPLFPNYAVPNNLKK